MLRSAERVGGRQSKRISLLFGLGMVATFLLFAGASASIVRAAIVSVLSIIAGYYGRQFKPLALLLLAGVITGFASPFYVWSDASWYLSFLAFYGVMILGPLVSARWPAKLKESVVMQVALESLCAEIMTLPFILHSFGQMSLVGLIGNVLVVALVPLAMLLGMIAGLAGMLVPTVAGWFAWPAQLLLTYMLDAATLLSRVPHIFLEHIGFSLSQMIVSYVAIVALTWLLWWKQGQKAAKIGIEIGNFNQPITTTAALSSRLL